MNNTSKVLFGCSIVALGVLLFTKVKDLANFASLLSFTPKIDGGLKKIKFQLSKLTIPFALDIQNRTSQEAKITLSGMTIYHNGKTLAKTQPTTASVVIKGNTTSTLSGIKVDIPLVTLISVIGQTVTTLISGGEFDKIVNSLSFDVAGILNDSVVINLTDMKVGESKDVATTKGAVAGIMGLDKKKKKKKGLFRKIFAVATANPLALIKRKKKSKISGLGLCAASKRKISPIAEVEMYLPPRTSLKYRDLVMIPNGTTSDTVGMMHEVAKKYKSDTELLAKHLKGGTLRATLQNIFDFVYKYVQYVPDSRVVEQVRRPLRSLYDQKGDCDCYATLIGSMLENLGIKYKFRIADYGRGWQHVYVIVPDGNGYLTCDPVLDTCFKEKTPVRVKDF